MKYRKKPIVIEAVQWTKQMRDACLFDGAPLPSCVFMGLQNINPHTRTVYTANAYVMTLEGGMILSVGDWIITGVAGEKYPCKPDIFEASYDPVDEQSGGQQ